MRFGHLLFYVTCFMSLSLPSLGSEENRVGILHYVESFVPSGYFVCEPGDVAGEVANCYFLNDFSRTLVPKSDTSGAMSAGSISSHQGNFLEVKLDQLATSVYPNSFKSTQIFDFYIKLHWKGERAGNLNLELSDSHVIKGQAVRSSDGDLEINILSVPDLFILSMFMPRLEVAEMFGRNAYTEAYELEHDIKLWMTLLINPVLRSYFDKGEPAQVNVP